MARRDITVSLHSSWMRDRKKETKDGNPFSRLPFARRVSHACHVMTVRRRCGDGTRLQYSAVPVPSTPYQEMHEWKFLHPETGAAHEIGDLPHPTGVVWIEGSNSKCSALWEPSPWFVWGSQSAALPARNPGPVWTRQHTIRAKSSSSALLLVYHCTLCPKNRWICNSRRPGPGAGGLIKEKVRYAPVPPAHTRICPCPFAAFAGGQNQIVTSLPRMNFHYQFFIHHSITAALSIHGIIQFHRSLSCNTQPRPRHP